ncbi:MAG TPA: protein kinase [Pyrinomonadaceae bacterium]|jgi:serine/threonine-protein kinase|nr:protein kinase [Pyrinomonadaceae bacterium]
MAFCHECGAKNAPDDPFCGNCGAVQLSAPASSATIIGDGVSAAASPAPEATASQLEDTESPDKDAGAESIAPVESSKVESSRVESTGVESSSAKLSSVELSADKDSRAPVVKDDAPLEKIGAAGVDEDAAQPAASEDKATGELARGDDAAAPATETVRAGSTGGRKPTVQQQEPGAVLNNRYEIVRRIGGGGMGAVYLAKDRHLGDAPRAVKEMVESHLDNSQHEKAIGDFKRESLLLTSLEHPSIPTIYDYFYDDEKGRFYLVMKYISGGDFAGRLRNSPGGRIDEKTVTDWAVQVADVLDYLHKRPKPIIYRDLKPANLMIDGNTGRVMLIDFGIARWVAPQEKGVTAVGTMGYAPPELFSGKVEPASDIYSLGATMFHLLTGSDPQDNPLLIFDFTKNPRPRQIAPAISTEMERILMRAVEYKPENRFRSAGELRETLAAHLEKLRRGEVSYGATPAQQLGGETIQVETVFCGFCGGRIAADDVFCAHCGMKQPLVGAGSSAALRAARATAKLIVAGTTELDVSFVLQKESNLLGRSDPQSNIFPEVDLSKFDLETKVSRRHARIWREGETFLIEDLNSVNGTVINDAVRLAPRQARVLESGDKLRLGETTLHFLVG